MGLGEIDANFLEADFWPGIICGLRSLSSILVPVGVPDPELCVTTFIPAFGSRSRQLYAVFIRSVPAHESNACERHYPPHLL